MALEDKARRLVGDLQRVMEEAQAADKKNPSGDGKLSAQEVRVLRAVGRKDCCIMSGIADAICLSLSSVTGLIDRLVEKKLVRRDRSNEDRRIVQVELTDEGREARDAAMEGPVAFARGLLKGLNAEEQDAMLALFRKVAERIELEKHPA